MKHLFARFEAGIAGLSDADLSAALEAALAVARLVRDRDAGTIEGLSATELRDEALYGAQIIGEMRAETAARVEGVSALDDVLAEGDPEPVAPVAPVEPVAPVAPVEPVATPAPVEPVAPVAPVEPLAAATDDDDDATDDAEDEALAASAKKAARKGAGKAKAAVVKPTPTERISITASADIAGVRMGEELDRLGVAKAMVARRRDLGRTDSSVRQEKVPVAMVAAQYPPERQLTGDGISNTDKVLAIIDQDALVASGGLCAPCTPYYGLEMLSGSQRPLRDLLPSFLADRGCIVHIPPATLAAVAGSDAVGEMTMDEDAAMTSAGPFKTCLHVPCDPQETCEVGIRFHCLQFGNVPTMTYPEHVAHYTDLTLAAQARLAESLILDNFKTGSTAVTTSITGGIWSTLPAQILAAIAGMKSRHRMRDGVNFRAVFPFWLKYLFEIDDIRSAFEHLDEENFEEWAAGFGVTVSYYIDSSTAGAQLFAPQTAGALLDFNANIEWFLYPEGTWLFLDGGTLELGLVRDSTLNLQNQYQMFGESLEGACKIGIESLFITSNLCASGVKSAPMNFECDSGAALGLDVVQTSVTIS